MSLTKMAQRFINSGFFKKNRFQEGVVNPLIQIAIGDEIRMGANVPHLQSQVAVGDSSGSAISSLKLSSNLLTALVSSKPAT